MADQNDVILESFPSRQVLDLIADKWRPLVMYTLGQGTNRYSDLQRQLPGISKKMLTQTLRRLEDDGLLKRKVHPVVPPHVDYDLTALGNAFREPIAALCEWAKKHPAEIKAVQRNRLRNSPAAKK
jgi:DNA-binding HxlR family transcriptional regulator